MGKFRLNNRTKSEIYSSTGMDSDFIANADVSVIDSRIENLHHTKLKPATLIGGLLSRGSVYLMFKRFFTKTEIEQQLSRIRP